jgi:TolB-like protein
MNSVRWLLSLVIFGLLQTGTGFGAVTRVAIRDFDNLTGDKALDWLGIGLADTLRTDLARIPDFRFVERKYQTGKAEAVQVIISGEFRKVENRFSLTARVVDVATGVIRASASVDGAYQDVIAFPHQVAAKLAVAMKESPPPAPASASTKNLEAFHAFSDGVYYFRNGLFQDALAQFDAALAKQPDDVDAQFYKGLALEKLERWDDAIAALKRSLPRAEPVRRLKWNWQPPAAPDAAKHGLILGVDTSDVSLQRNIIGADRGAPLRKQVIYTERHGPNTVLHFVDLEKHSVQRLELPDDKISLNDAAIGNDKVTLLISADLTSFHMPESIELYAVGSDDSTVAWHTLVKGYTTQLPLFGMAADVFYVYFRENGELTVLDDRSQALRWRRQDLDIDVLDPPKIRKTGANGAVMIVKSANTVQAIRLSDGKDAWVFDAQTAKFTDIVTDDAVVIFDPGRRVTIVDIETGKRLRDIPVPQFTDNLRLGAAGSTVLSGAIVQRIRYISSQNHWSFMPSVWMATSAGTRRFNAKSVHFTWIIQAAGFTPAPRQENC